MTDAPEGGGGDSPGRRWTAFAFLLLGLLIVVMDQTITAVVLPDIVSDLDVSLADATLTVTVFTVAAASTFVVMGALADHIGRRRAAVSALVGFAVGSFVTGIAPSLPILLAGRAIQGLVLAMFAPATIGLLNAGFPEGRARVLAFSLWATVSGSGVAIGPLLGGAIADVATWRLAFFLNVPLAVVAALGIGLLTKESSHGTGRPRLDVPGAALLAVGMSGLVIGLQEATSLGWFEPKEHSIAGLSPVPFAIGLGTLALALFARTELRRDREGRFALLPRRLLAIRRFRLAIVASALMSMALTTVVLLVSIYVQFVLERTSLTAGLVLMTLGGGMVVGGVLASRAISRLGRRRVGVAGIGIQPIVLGGGMLLVGDPGSPWAMTPFLAAYGLLYGAAFSALTNLIFADVPHELASMSAGVSSTFRLGAGAVGTALLVSVVGALAAGGLASDLDDVPALSGAERQTIEQAAHFAVGPGSDSSDRRVQTLADLAERPATAVLIDTLRARLVRAVRGGFALAIGFLIVGFAVAVRLPRGEPVT